MAGNFADEFDISDEIDIDVDSKVKGALSKLVSLLEKDEEMLKIYKMKYIKLQKVTI